ncbi:sensor histidine kinase [Catelliglobosispora koreensis]|uniref:sensor histidine kinase n=1 Tax=Catelliglobosispora koreensis TaxID=129052 RepID=UPI00035D0771|nr:HAMP domain-containing sensor histidine kinase [Catelliglobosispora koreensis]
MKRRLVLLVLATCTLMLAAFLIPLALLVRSAAAERATSAAIAEAQRLAPLVVTLTPVELTVLLNNVNAQSHFATTVFLGDHSALGATAARTDSVGTAARGASITRNLDGGREVLIATAGRTDGIAVIRVFIPASELTSGVNRAWAILFGLGAGVLVVATLVANRLSRTIIRPLSAVADVADRLTAGDLTIRAIPAGPPEIRRLGVGLNDLASRIGELLKNEREAAADLSHRLRTPLTALRIDAEGIADQADRSRLLADIDALERTVNEIIRTARRGRDQTQICDAATVLRQRVDFWSALADEEQRPLSIQITPAPAYIAVTGEDFAACVDALLGNVFAHTPEGTPLAIDLVKRPDGSVVMAIADRGPGLDPTIAARGFSGVGSTGLGLDIANRTAIATGGTLTLTQTSGGGLTVIAVLAPPSVSGRPRSSAR